MTLDRAAASALAKEIEANPRRYSPSDVLPDALENLARAYQELERECECERLRKTLNAIAALQPGDVGEKDG